MSQLIPQIVEVVEAVREAQKRILDDLSSVGFFGKDDVWVYQMVSDDLLCDQCRLYAEIEIWGGHDLRHTFPFLEVESQDIIRVHVHPNCRCYLMRLFV